MLDIADIGALMILDKVLENHRSEEDVSIKQTMDTAMNTDIEDRSRFNPPNLGNNIDVYV